MRRPSLQSARIAMAAAAVGLCLAPQGATAQGRGTLTIAVPSVKPGLDPAFASTADGYMLTQAIFSNLTRIDDKLAVRPQLATSWNASADGKTWTFNLVKRAKFHNGREVTAEDAKFSLDRILDPKTGSQGARLLGPITAVEVADTHTLKITLASAYGDLPVALAGTHARIIAKENLDRIASEPIGSGPFRLKEYVQGTRAVLVRNDDYFEKGLPMLQEIRQVYIKEIPAQATALARGEIDVMYSVPHDLIASLKKSPGVQVLEVPSSNFQTITMFVDRKPTNDPRVRQALRLAAQREAMLDVATGGHGVVGNDTPVAPITPWYDKGIAQRNYDPQKARQLLKEAGFPNGIDITLYTSSGRPGLEEAAVAYRETAAAAGIRVKIESVEIARLFSEFARQPRDNAIVHVNWFGRPVGDPLSLFVKTGAGFNYSKYSNKRVDELLTQAEAELDEGKRRALYGEVQKIVWEDGAELIPYFRNYIIAVRKNVKRFEMNPTQWVDFRETEVD